MEVSRKRNPNWGESEKLWAMEEILSRSEDLFGKFRGASSGAKAKEKAWQEIADALNATGRTTCLRTIPELKKLYYNCKGKAKEKLDNLRKTGGGPMPNFNPCEDVVIQHWAKTNSAEAEGIDGGMESTIFNTTSGTSSTEVTADLSLTSVEHVGENVISTYVPILNMADQNETVASGVHVSNTCTQHQKPRSKRRREKEEHDLYDIEKKRIEAETNKIHAETLYWESRKNNEDELFRLKKELLLKQIGNIVPVEINQKQSVTEE